MLIFVETYIQIGIFPWLISPAIFASALQISRHSFIFIFSHHGNMFHFLYYLQASFRFSASFLLLSPSKVAMLFFEHAQSV